MTRVLVIGGVSWNTLIFLEHFPPPAAGTIFSRAYLDTLGETGAGKALAFARLGMQTDLHAMLGDDEYGQKIRETLEWEPNLNFLTDKDPQGTHRHVNLMNADGGRISIYLNGGEFDPPVNPARLDAEIAAADLVALNITNYCRRFIPVLRAAGKPVWVDIHDYDGQNSYHADFIAAADVLFLSSDLLPDYRDFMEKQIAGGKELVVCTHGKRGASALLGDGTWLEQPVLPYQPVLDTNGAGDSFFAGYAWAHLRRFPPPVCLRIASLAAGLCVTARELAHPHLSEALIRSEYKHWFGMNLESEDLA